MGGRIPWTKIAANCWLLFVCIFPQPGLGESTREDEEKAKTKSDVDTTELILNIVAAIAAIVGIVMFIRSMSSTASKTIFSCRSRNRNRISPDNQGLEMAPYNDLMEPQLVNKESESKDISGKQPNKTTILTGLCFMAAAVFYMFPFHALIQIHVWMGRQLDNRTFAVPFTKASIIPIFNMALFWPMLVLHVCHADKYIVRLLKKCLTALDFSEIKIIVGSLFFLTCMSICWYLSQVSLTTAMIILMIPTTLLFSISEGLVEPTIFSMAGRWSEEAVDWVQTGVGVCGVMVPTIDLILAKSGGKEKKSEPVSLSISSEYEESVLSKKLSEWFKMSFTFTENLWKAGAGQKAIPSGVKTKDIKGHVKSDDSFSEFFIRPYSEKDFEEQHNLQILIWIGIGVGILLVLIFYTLRRIAPVHGDGSISKKPAHKQNEDEEFDKWMWTEIGPSIWAQCLNYTFSLMLWPSVYFLAVYSKEDCKNSSLDNWLMNEDGKKCLSSAGCGEKPEFDPASKKSAILLIFNGFDFIGRSSVVVLGRVCPELIESITPKQQLTISWMRAVLPISVHLLLRTATPNRMTLGLIILAITALSNGFCGSVSMRSAAVLAKQKMGHLKPDVVAEKVAAMMHPLMSALFVGLGVGSSVHHLLAQIDMDIFAPDKVAKF